MDLYQNFILEYQGQDNKFQLLDVDPRSDDDASLMSSEVHVETYSNNFSCLAF